MQSQQGYSFTSFHGSLRCSTNVNSPMMHSSAVIWYRILVTGQIELCAILKYINIKVCVYFLGNGCKRASYHFRIPCKDLTECRVHELFLNLFQLQLKTEISVTNIFNSFQFLIIHLFSIILIFLITVVCITPPAVLIFLSC